MASSMDHRRRESSAVTQEGVTATPVRDAGVVSGTRMTE
jgi:hypothetical protein